ncbi:tRNA (adenosine(37)-N6)-threonylcarbamoyltransferase complex dimerization subunit type 1 TsaB [Radiobacillus kanasensis]|uniref:tRNA (adenosine(37)-N6)-threonylcarbamoyltransferase complex dimerization subunit type 1 TsaB n=1 Tax=Radiobacillus kanasensis TaxID=2844358 RepID=UPI001E5B0B3E|nr:tRNA (adenosine(37)-N6)-threonylcarbamoyltransferase complex dimerization subunit type 1 TsaB [Radiobacillus kanasensis]UFT99835.1 tRNA (adenosine(37)-N6)-threonylcarbamoyltransferase complex dimerization subunit type 1 TsaB [Radiobacillus kanasensis]
MNILAMDTSNQVLGIAIMKDGKVAGEYTSNVQKNHSVRLMPAINQLMSDTNTKPEDLDRIVVAKGPGSYTGVRIGLTTAKTMGWALGIPVVAISSLELVVRQALYVSDYICPFFDARRGLVYTGLYGRNTEEKLQLYKEETNILFEDWLKQLKSEEKSVLFLSQDLELHKQRIEDIMGDLAVFPHDSFYHIPRPSLMMSDLMDKEVEPIHSLTPSYLRLVEAEAKWLEQQEEQKND